MIKDTKKFVWISLLENTQSWGLIQGIKHGHNMLLSCIKGLENGIDSELTHTRKETDLPLEQVQKYNEQQT